MPADAARLIWIDLEMTGLKPETDRIIEIDGRKHFIAATMTDANGTLLSEANGLMVRLLPHQP